MERLYIKEKLEQNRRAAFDTGGLPKGWRIKVSGKKKVTAKILSQSRIAPDIYDLWIETELAENAGAGQFTGVYPQGGGRLLPRPISICEVDRFKSGLRLVYRIAGGGTRELAERKQGETVEILGILGNGFPISSAAGKKVLLLGGGIGIPPLLQTLKELRAAGTETVTVAGYRDHILFLKEDFEQYGKCFIATEDGSAGVKGNVLTAVRKEGIQADMIMACGPMPMLRAIKAYAGEENMEAFISLEERMACGVGACLGCVCRTIKEDPHSHVHNARICTDGPVFDAGEVDI